jgi:hypothetical protein
VQLRRQVASLTQENQKQTRKVELLTQELQACAASLKALHGHKSVDLARESDDRKPESPLHPAKQMRMYHLGSGSHLLIPG